MADQEQPAKTRKTHIWRYFPVLIVLGLAIYLLVPQITTLKRSWSVVQNMTWWAVGLAAVSEVFSWLGNGYMLHSILAINQQKLSVKKGALIAIATLSISLVAGGAIGLAATYSWIYKENRDGHTAALAGMLPSFLNTGVLVGVSIIGTLYLLLLNELSTKKLIELGITLFFLGLLAVVAYLCLRFSGTVTRVVIWLAGRWASLWHQEFTPGKTIEVVDRFFDAVKSLRRGKWLRPLLGGVINIGFDMLTLFFMFVAAGSRVSPGALFAGYGLPLLLAKMAFVFPGGIGVIEGSMAALFNSLQVPESISVVVVMGYRFFSFWLPTLFGFLAAAYLSGKLFSKKKVE